jgi:hypothetical protein
MPAFKLAPGVRSYPVERCITPFLEVVGYEVLKRRAESLEGKIAGDRHAGIFLPKRHQLELALWRIVKHHRAYGRIPALYVRDQGLDVSLYRAFNFIDVLPDVARHLSPAAMKRLKGRIRTAFTDENDISSLAQEMDVISWLTQLGCSITCSDFEGVSGGADFVAEREGVEFEVECKAIRSDKGRKIHEYDALALLRYLSEFQDRHILVPSPEGVIVKVRIPKRMPRDPVVLSRMASFIGRSIETREGGRSEDCSTEIVTFPIASSPFSGPSRPDDMLSRRFIEGILGMDTATLVVTARPGRSALVVHLESEQRSDFAEAIYDSLKLASTQLSGTRPGMITAVMSEGDAEDFTAMEDSKVQLALETIIQRLYAGDGRNHVCAVHIFGELGYGLTRSGYFPAPGQMYSSYNESNPSHTDPRLDLEQAIPQ